MNYRGGSRGNGGDVRTPINKREREREGGRRLSAPLLNISAFIHSSVKCNKSLYLFTRWIALLGYLITFELLKHSPINQKTKWYYNPLDINFIKILQTLQYKLPHFQQRNMRKLANIGRGYSETRCKLVILNVFIGQFYIFEHYRPRNMLFRVPLPSCSTICRVQKFKIGQWKRSK
jgi:hypothetical protein